MATEAVESPPFEQSERKPLWGNLDIEVIGVSGEFSSGKTLFGLTICPEETLLIDLEKSAGTYAGSLGVKKRIDFPVYLQQKHPNGYKSIDVFVAFTEFLKVIKPGEYRVIMIDPISDVEQGLVDWVKSNPQHFGRTANQYDKASGLLWADVKAHWKIILAGIATLCETFVFTTHMRNVWKGSSPTGRREPKGKDTLEELASLFLIMDRSPDRKTGKPPAKPTAIVRKSRLVSVKMQDGEMDMVPTLPPRLPVATPKSIRDYIANPPNPNKLKKVETAPEEQLSEDQRLLIQRDIAQANENAEEQRLQRLQMAELAAERQKQLREQQRQNVAAATAEAPSTKATQQAAVAQDAPKDDPEPEPKPEPEPASETSHLRSFFPNLTGEETREQLLELCLGVRDELGIEPYKWVNQILAKRNVKTLEECTDDQIGVIYTRLLEVLHKRANDKAAAAKN